MHRTVLLSAFICVHLRFLSSAHASPPEPRFRHQTIDDGGMACEDLCLADLDANRDLDIIASGRATKNVRIYWKATETKKN